MTTTNPVTGDLIKTKTGGKDAQRAYADGWERIFGNKSSSESTKEKTDKQEKDA